MSPGGAIPTRGAALAAWVRDARERSLELVSDLSDEELVGPRLAIVNPLLWEIGHVAWFQERWVLRHALGAPPLRADADALWDSIAIAHDARWDLALPPREETFAYVRAVRDRVLERLDAGDPDAKLRYFVLLTVFHEDMHTEAFTYTRQTLGYAAPQLAIASDDPGAVGEVGAGAADLGDARVPGGRFVLGAAPDEPFVFDNEKWAHEMEVAPFAIARAAVTQTEFARFVEAGGYARREWWSDAGWRWREQEGAELPLHWRRAGGGFERRRFDAWLPLEADLPMLHVSWFEAEAYWRFAGRRLPTELEWEVAAAGEPGGDGARLAPRKRRLPWGEGPPDASRAQLDWRGGGPAGVHAYAAGESAFGCRQLIGNVWEWTSSDFGPYPGFAADPYREYSEPWFRGHKVLRGGCWATRGRLLRNTWRNFYEPHRRDVWSGFRTCAP